MTFLEWLGIAFLVVLLSGIGGVWLLLAGAEPEDDDQDQWNWH